METYTNNSSMNEVCCKDEDLIDLYNKTQLGRYFEKLYARYCYKMYQECLFIVRNPEEAADLTHDIFLKLLIKVNTFNGDHGDGEFSSWVYAITVNHCIDYMTYKSKSQVILFEFKSLLESEYDNNITDDDKDVMIIKFSQAFDRLEIDEKCILLMKYAQEFTIREIADKLNLSISAVKMRLSRASCRLRKYCISDQV